MSELAVSLPCECGGQCEVHSADAGTQVKCSCGQSLTVPSLGKLRQLAGRDAYVTNPAEAIRKKTLSGIHPAGDRCIVCGSNDPQQFKCVAECESSVLREAAQTANSFTKTLMWFGTILLMPRLLLLFFLRGRQDLDEEPTILGHDVIVEFQLPVCAHCTNSGHNPLRMRAAKQLMKRVEIYQQLLDYYPRLTLKVSAPE